MRKSLFLCFLQELRDKFEQEQVKRFANQYVTSRILEHEWLNRHVYGLPENINDEPQYAVKVSSSVPIDVS